MRFHASTLATRLLPWALLAGTVLTSGTGCRRWQHRLRADREVTCLVDEKSNDPRWAVPGSRWHKIHAAAFTIRTTPTTPRQQFAVQRAQLELDSARTAKDVLVDFTKVKMLEDLRSQEETAKAKMDAETAAFALESARVKRLEKQLESCIITAPKEGMVVYANEISRHRGIQTVTIEEGAMVRERQTIIRLPDKEQMQVKVNVHESKVEQMELGMQANIQILDRKLQGTVTSVASQPEPASYYQASVKEYATTVQIDGESKEESKEESKDLLPGMTAEVEILVADLKDVIALPVAAVVEKGGHFYCWVKTPKKIERRRLVMGMSNDEFIEIKDGGAVGDEVVLSPRAVVPEARDIDEDESPDDKKSAEDKSDKPAPPADETPSPGDEAVAPPSATDSDEPRGPRPVAPVRRSSSRRSGSRWRLQPNAV